MFVFRLLGAISRATALFALGLVIVVTFPSDAFAADAQVNVVEPSDQLSWRYDPEKITVTAGSTVTWTNNGGTAVTVTSADGLFSADSLAPGSSFSYTFDTPGRYRYFCVPYPHMKGEITVTQP